jgi:predicted phosphate transport protein (TIGR00153 family)
MAVLFKKIKLLENQIDEFLDAVSQGGEVFKLGVKDYLGGNPGIFKERIETISKFESRADDLRRRIENHLYAHSLLPEYRGDVLELLESMDDIIDTAKETLNQFSIERPVILAELKEEFIELVEVVAKAVDSVVLSARAFFRDVSAIKNHLHKVYFFEKEADKASNRLKRHIFDLSIDLSHKNQLRYFTHNVDSIADCAEGVADKLNIFAIKRMV